jgi:Eukaryotic aspartyl protease
LIIVSNEIADAVYGRIPGAEIDPSSDLWSFPCSAVGTLPNISFVMDGKNFNLTPSQYILPKYLVGLMLLENGLMVKLKNNKLTWKTYRTPTGEHEIQLCA